MTEELSNPFRTLPMAIFISMTLCTTIYLLVNVAYFSILSPFEMMASPAVANTVANLFLQVRRKRHKWGIKHHSMVLPDLSLSTPCLELTHAYSRTHIQFMHTRTGCWYHDELYIPYLVSFPLIPFSKWNKESSETQLYYSWAKIKIIQYKTQNIIPHKGKKENKKLFDLFLVTL